MKTMAKKAIIVVGMALAAQFTVSGAIYNVNRSWDNSFTGNASLATLTGTVQIKPGLHITSVGGSSPFDDVALTLTVGDKSIKFDKSNFISTDIFTITADDTYLTISTMFHNASSGYVVDYKSESCPGFGPEPSEHRFLARWNSILTSGVSKSERLKIHGPAGRGCNAGTALVSADLLKVFGLTPANDAA